jgi:hypothetical protein
MTEEVLIEFKEIIGEHSGENLANIVWKTMQDYGLVGKVNAALPLHQRLLTALQVIAVMCDNATNNNKMMLFLARMSRAAGFPMSPDSARMRCLPHILHLSALKVSNLLMQRKFRLTCT